MRSLQLPLGKGYKTISLIDKCGNFEFKKFPGMLVE